MVAVSGTALVYFQQWSQFPPSEMIRTFLAGERVHHFRNMHKIYPSQPNRKSTAPRAWPEVSAHLKISYQFENEQHTMSAFLARTFTTGLLVIKDGDIVHEQCRLGETASSAHTSCSVAKSFVSTLVGMAVHEGTIASVYDRIEKHLPELGRTAYGAASIKNVLQM